ncbi:MAG: hypothetical protein K2N73_14420, partial [Lachnospiraceae bacterium]|nr:hypothetical protein [Lachnospiraceae bacterium]
HIYEAVILTGWCVRYVGRETIYNEVFSGNEDIIFTVMVYTIGEKMFYIYDLSECTVDQISVCETYISRCRDEADIEWVTEEFVEEAIKNQCGLLGIDYNAIEQQEDMEWITCYNSHQRQFSSAYKLLRCEL